MTNFMRNYVIQNVCFYPLYVSGNTVQVEKELLNLHTGRSLTESTIPDAVSIQFGLLMMSTVLPEAYRG